MEKAIINLLFLIGFSILLYLKAAQFKYRRLLTLLIVLAVVADISMNAYQQIKTLNGYAGYNFARHQYNMSTPGFEDVVTAMSKKDQDFYRTNVSIRMTPNDGIRFGYKGITNFNTLSNGVLHDFMYHLGYSTTLGVRSLMQNNGVLASDALLGFKYAISDQPIEKHGYSKNLCVKDICLYKNNNTLPIGFMMEKEQTDLIRKEDQAFQNQNLFLGGQVDYFRKIKPVETTYHNLSVKKEGQLLLVKKKLPNEEGSIEMTFDLQGRKQFYTLLSAGKGIPGLGETTVYVNGKSLGVYPQAHYERILDLGAFSDKKVNVKIVFSVPETQLAYQLFYALDIPSFEERIVEIRQQSFDMTSYSDTTVQGKINAKEADVLFFSIPYDPGWKVKVDGKQAPVVKMGGFIGVNVAEGLHEVELNFIPRGFVIGSILTIAAVLGLLARFIFTNRKG